MLQDEQPRAERRFAYKSGENKVDKLAFEDYLKTIYLLAQEECPVSTARLAQARGVTAPSVTGMVQRLAERGYVDYRKHYGVSLTAEGEAIALKILRRHRLLELYLTEELDYGWDEVHEEAERLEHAISEQFAERITTILGDPRYDPHGQPIPARDGALPIMRQQPLSSLCAGEKAIVAQVTDDSNAELLRFLSELRLTPGTAVMLLEKAPFDGPLTLQIDNQEKIVGHLVADSVLVTIDNNQEANESEKSLSKALS